MCYTHAKCYNAVTFYRMTLESKDVLVCASLLLMHAAMTDACCKLPSHSYFRNVTCRCIYISHVHAAPNPSAMPHIDGNVYVWRAARTHSVTVARIQDMLLYAPYVKERGCCVFPAYGGECCMSAQVTECARHAARRTPRQTQTYDECT